MKAEATSGRLANFSQIRLAFLVRWRVTYVHPGPALSAVYPAFRFLYLLSVHGQGRTSAVRSAGTGDRPDGGSGYTGKASRPAEPAGTRASEQRHAHARHGTLLNQSFV